MKTLPHSRLALALLALTPIQLLILTLSVWLLYGHSLDVPFYLDDFSSIQENPTIYNWKGTFSELWQFAGQRIVGYYSFALNYQFDHFQVKGYHVVNILIHLLSGYFVFLLIRGLLQTPFMKTQASEILQRYLPFVVALLFLIHPLQIQAVTYVVQRLASMAALFYIAALASFVYARLSEPSLRQKLWITACILFTLLGFFTKQNTATLPLAFLLIELVFFPLHKKRLQIAAGIAIGGLILVWFILAGVFQKNPFSLEAMQALTQETSLISRDSYLATQFSVLFTYLKLLVFPVGMHIDYAYPITDGLGAPKAVIALLGHLGLLALAVFCFRRNPLVSFGIFFYYLTHLVESSIIPIRDVIFEHRTYLPNLGFFMVIAWLALEGLPKKFTNYQLHIYAGLAIICVILAGMTWQRNAVWRDPIALWQDNIVQSPSKKRGFVILGKHLLQANRPSEALEVLKNSGEVRQNLNGTVTTTYTTEAVLNMVVAYKKLKDYQTALKFIDQALVNPSILPFDKAKFYTNRGNIFYEQNQFQEAETSYLEAIKLYPQGLTARANLASIFAVTGRLQESEKLYTEMLAIDPNNQDIQNNLAQVRAKLAEPH